MYRSLSALVVSILLLSAYAWPAEPAAFRTKFTREISDRPVVLVAAKVTTPPVIDGEVDRDAVWSQLPRDAHTEGAWVQIGTKNPSARQTVVYSCYDEHSLYFGFVCEEAELQNVRMDGALAAGIEQVGPDDCVEVILEIGGVQGEGEAYSFRANSRAQRAAWGGTSIPPLLSYHTPAWTHAGKFGPNRWMLEMAIPFETLKRRPTQRGLATPSRGDVVGLKLVRYGAGQQDPKNRMVSTWNTNILLTLPHISGCNGLLYFDDSNSLRDGTFSAAAKDSPWEHKGPVENVPEGGVRLAPGASVSQAVDVRPNRYYLFAVDAEGAPELTVDGKKPAAKGGFWTGPNQDRAVVSLQAAEPARVKGVRMEYQPGEEPPGPCCLTNNYRHADRNIREVLTGAPEGKYQYVSIDYLGRITGDDNPAIRMKSWAHDYNMRVEDVGGREGWIPFSQGSITAKGKPVFWQTSNPDDTSCWGRHSVVVDVDLGREYFVRGLDVLWPAPNVINFEVWGKLGADDEWTFLYIGDGPFVEPSKRRTHRRAYESIRGLDSVVRFVRWRVKQAAGDGIFPQMDGVQEFRVWGESAAGRAGIKPFAAWVADAVKPPIRATTAVLNQDSILIVPRPRKLETREGWFVFGPRTRIVAQAAPEARKVARQIREEILDRWQVDVPVEEEAADSKMDDVVYVGQPALSPAAERLRVEEKLEIDAAKPQGHGISASPRRVVVLGRDEEGLYWGVQSLMMAIRWKAAGAEGLSGPGVHAMKVADWPGTTDRGFIQGKNYAALLNMPESEISRIKRLARLCSRFKFNAIYLNPKLAGEQWPPGTLQKLCREIRDEYHLELRPDFFDHPRWNQSWWSGVLGWAARADPAKDWKSAVEHDPDEGVDDCGGALNFCPLDTVSYEMVFGRLDDILGKFAYPSRVYLFAQVNSDTAGGARWGVCRNCLKSGKTPEELYLIYLRQLAGHLQERQAVGVLGSHLLRYGPRSAKDRRLISLDFRDVPAALMQDVPDQGPDAAAAVAALSPGRCLNGPREWPSAGRFGLGAFTESEMLVSLSGGDIQWGNGSVFREGSLLDQAESMWYAPDRRPSAPPDTTDTGTWVYGWWFRHELPGWRAGAHPSFVCLDLKPFANHGSRATGTETLQPGRTPEIDLGYVPTGRQTLANVEFDIIDPAQNGGKSVVMLGRPPKSTLPAVAKTISEGTGPIPVGRRLASVALLRTRWQASVEGMHWGEYWLRPTGRVVFDDGSWLVVDSFQHPVEGFVGDNWRESDSASLYSRLGWKGNGPTSDGVGLNVVEWVNPYPEKVVHHVEFFTPDFENVRGAAGKRVNAMCEAIVAITGIEPVEQDMTTWSRRADRTPRLPATQPRRGDEQCLKIEASVNTNYANDKRGFSSRFVAGPANVPFSLRLDGQAMLFDAQSVYCKAFTPFGVTLTFDAPLAVRRVEILGPFQHYGGVGAREQRRQKVDVRVEFSEDGEKWQRAGEIRGISAEADFLPVELPEKPVKALRLTATGAPYHDNYHPAAEHGGMFEDAWMSPHFCWRLVVPADRLAP